MLQVLLFYGPLPRRVGLQSPTACKFLHPDGRHRIWDRVRACVRVNRFD